MNHIFYKDLISIIVPVYNTECYIIKCIKSIQNQTYKNLEIILIDDGSNDKSGKICDLFADIDSRIKVIHTENRGVSKARNLGINISSGKYIAFVDSDDSISPFFVEELYKVSILYNVNVAVCRIESYERFILKKHKNCICNNFVILNSIKSMEYLLNLDSGYACGPCNKLYKKDLIKNFNEHISIGEDLLFNFKIYFNEKNSTVFLKRNLYFVSKRYDSASRKQNFTSSHLKEVIVWEYILNKLKTNEKFNSALGICEYNLKNVVFATLIRLVHDKNNTNKVRYYYLKNKYKHLFFKTKNRKIKDFLKLLLFNVPYEILYHITKFAK